LGVVRHCAPPSTGSSQVDTIIPNTPTHTTPPIDIDLPPPHTQLSNRDKPEEAAAAEVDDVVDVTAKAEVVN
jgi:hypothetical protein